MWTYFKIYSPFLLILIFGGILVIDGQDDWCYEGKCGPRYWKGKCKFGALQSPINIIPSQTVKARDNRKLKFNKEYYKSHYFQIKNNGHTVQLQINADEKSNLQLEGAGFKGRYYFSQMHFHWGQNKSLGSEHLISGKRFPLELHLVHEQVSGHGGIGVLSVIFGISKKDNAALKPIIDALPSVQYAYNSLTSMSSGINLISIFPNVWDVFRYEGSLTTPPCSEKILWSVFTQRMPISAKQVAEFRKVLDTSGKPILRNYRNVKALKTKGRNHVYWMQIDKKKMKKETF